MPMPDEGRYVVPVYRPEIVEDHERNIRSVEQAFNGLPFFNPIIYRYVAQSGTSYAYTFDGFTDSPHIDIIQRINLTKQLPWTSIKFSCALTANFNLATRATIAVEGLIYQSASETALRECQIASIYLGGSDFFDSIVGTIYDTEQNLPLPSGLYTIEFRFRILDSDDYGLDIHIHDGGSMYLQAQETPERPVSVVE